MGKLFGILISLTLLIPQLSKAQRLEYLIKIPEMECSKCRILIEPFQKVYLKLKPKMVLPKRLQSVQKEYLENYGFNYYNSSDVLISDSIFDILPTSKNPILFFVKDGQILGSLDLFNTSINSLSSLPHYFENQAPLLSPIPLSTANFVFANDSSFILNDRIKKSILYFNSGVFSLISTESINLKQVAKQLCNWDSSCIAYFLKSHHYLKSKNIAKSEFGSGFTKGDTIFIIGEIPRLIVEKSSNKLEREQFLIKFYQSKFLDAKRISPSKKHIVIDQWNSGGLFETKGEIHVNGGKFGFSDRQSQENLFRLEDNKQLKIGTASVHSRIPKSLIKASKGFMDYTFGDVLWDEENSPVGYYFKSNFSFSNFSNSTLFEDLVTKVPEDSIYILHSFVKSNLIYSFYKRRKEAEIGLSIKLFSNGQLLIDLPKFLPFKIEGLFRMGNTLCFYRENSSQIERIKLFN